MAGLFKNLFVGGPETRDDDESFLLTPLTTLPETSRRQRMNDKLRTNLRRPGPPIVGPSQHFRISEHPPSDRLPIIANPYAQPLPFHEPLHKHAQIPPAGQQRRKEFQRRHAENPFAAGHISQYSQRHQSRTNHEFTELVAPPPQARLPTLERRPTKYERPRAAPMPRPRNPSVPIIPAEPLYAISSRYPKYPTRENVSSARTQKPPTRTDLHPAVRYDKWYRENVMGEAPAGSHRSMGHSHSHPTPSKLNSFLSFLGLGESERIKQRRQREERKTREERERERRRNMTETERVRQRGRERDREREYYTRKTMERRTREDPSRWHWG